MLSYQQALDQLLAAAQPVEEIRTLPLTAAAGRVLALPQQSTVAVPPLDNSSMDGYAVRLADVPAEMVSILLGDVSKVLAMLRADGWDSPRLEALEQLFADAAKQPGNRDTLRHLLDALADFAGPVECWWQEG